MLRNDTAFGSWLHTSSAEPCYNHRMNNTLETHHQGVRLSLEIRTPAAVTLRINGLARDSAASDEPRVTLRVSSTAQTGYEWHELIEGIVTWTDGQITARLLANNQELVQEHYAHKEIV